MKQIKLLTGQDIEQEWYHQSQGENCPDIKSLANMVNDRSISLTSNFVPLIPLENRSTCSPRPPSEFQGGA